MLQLKVLSDKTGLYNENRKRNNGAYPFGRPK